MPKVRVDFSKARDFEALPVGVYLVTVEETEVKDSNSSEYQYIKWTLQVATGEFAGRKLWMQTSLSPKATFGLRLALQALGETNPELESDEFEMDPDDYLGRSALAVVSQEEYNQRMQNRVDKLLPPDSLSASNGSAKKTPAASAGIR